MNKDVTIVLLSHKSEDLILDFIDEIYNKFRIIIIDNSNDKKLEQKINKEYSSIIIKLIENYNAHPTEKRCTIWSIPQSENE